MNERYDILKKFYPNYLILIKKKDKIKFIKTDKLIVDTFKYENLKEVNQLILDNLDIVNIKEYSNNRYEEYYIKVMIKEILNDIKEKIKDEEENICNIN